MWRQHPPSYSRFWHKMPQMTMSCVDFFIMGICFTHEFRGICSWVQSYSFISIEEVFTYEVITSLKKTFALHRCLSLRITWLQSTCCTVIPLVPDSCCVSPWSHSAGRQAIDFYLGNEVSTLPTTFEKSYFSGTVTVIILYDGQPVDLVHFGQVVLICRLCSCIVTVQLLNFSTAYFRKVLHQLKKENHCNEQKY